MLTISLQINPFTNDVSVLKDGKFIKRTNRLSGFYTSFISTALHIREIILEDENVDSFLLMLETSMFERMFLDALFNDENPKFQIQHKDFLIATTIEKRIQSFFSFRKKYLADVRPIPPKTISIYASKAVDAEALIEYLNNEYPWIRDIGLSLAVSSRVVDTQINLFSDHAEIAKNAKFIPVLSGDIVPLVFCYHFPWQDLEEFEKKDTEQVIEHEIRQEASISLDHSLVVWNLKQSNAKLVIKNFFERYFIYPQIEKIISNFHPAIDVMKNFDEYVDFQLLNKVFETVIVHFPEELEKGEIIKIPIKTFFGERQPEFKISSSYREIIDADCNEETVTLVAHQLGDSDVKLEVVGIPTPIAVAKIKVADHGYATGIKIVLNDNPSKDSYITTPGSKVKLKLDLTYKDNKQKIREDPQNANWLISNEDCGYFDKENLVFYAQNVGEVKIVAKMARVQSEFTIIIKPNLTNYTLSLINKSDNRIKKLQNDDEQSIEYVRCHIMTPLRFRLERHPSNAITFPIAIECKNDGIAIRKNIEEDGFVINPQQVGKGKLVKISLPECNIVKSIVIDAIPIPRTMPILIVSLLATVLLVAGAIFLAPQNILLLVFGFLALAFNGYAIYISEKKIRYILILFFVIVATAIGYSICRKYFPTLSFYNGWIKPEEQNQPTQTAKEDLGKVIVTEPVSTTSQVRISPSPTETKLPNEGNPIQPTQTPIKQDDLTSKQQIFAEENYPDEFESYNKAKKSIRNRTIILRKAEQDGELPARLEQLQKELDSSITKFNTIRQEIVNLYNSKNNQKELK